ncbi:protein PARTING DANCERS isoform X2 [Capsicum annuum]|uniref:protein PARTING DANCERS isoform X2 n=1 Tax=Capsicum annuum TaxID=4072 RepID=UPI001FB14BBA|nr:protein PARTING DANCERS isoform X2 [Capsicum annuum]
MSRGFKNSAPFSNTNSCSSGVCMMSSTWRDEQHPSFLNFISCFLKENSFRSNIVPIAPDFIFNCGGLSVAFMFVTNWGGIDTASFFRKVQKLKEQFANFYVVITLPTKEQNDSLIYSYIKYGMQLGRPTFVPVRDLGMGFEKIVKIAHARGACKRQDALAKIKAEEKSVQAMEIYLQVVTSIPGVDSHDANVVFPIYVASDLLNRDRYYPFLFIACALKNDRTAHYQMHTFIYPNCCSHSSFL